MKKGSLALIAIVAVLFLGVAAWFALGQYIPSMSFAPMSIVGAYESASWQISFDSASTSAECKNTDPEFELISEMYTTGTAQGRSPMKTICGNYFSQEAVNYSDLMYLSFSVAQNPTKCVFRYQNAINAPYIGLEGVMSQNPNDPQFNYQCKFASKIAVPVASSDYSTMSIYSGTQELVYYSHFPSSAYKFVASNISFEISYTVPREEIPLALHYRTYSCPLPSGYQLVSDTFEQNASITVNSLGYNPAFFCERHPAIKILTATSTSTTATQIYKNLVAGMAQTVPIGERWTLFYATRDTQSKLGYNASIQIGELQGQLAAQVNLIEQLQATTAEKALLLSQLNMTLQQQAAAIAQLTSTSQQQAIYIQQLTTNNQEQAQLIASLTQASSEQAAIINSLNISIQEKGLLIAQLQTENDAQAAIINSLNLNLAEKAVLIASLTSNIEEQAAIISQLNLNLQQKAFLISQLQATTEYQAWLISEMQLSFTDQAAIINALNNTIYEDAALIHHLNLTTSEQGQLLANLHATIAEDAILISNLNSSNAAQAEIIRLLNLRIEDEAALILNLTQNNQQQAAIIGNLTQNNAEQAAIIAAMNLNVIEQAAIIANLTQNVQEQAAIIANLNLNLAEEQALVDALTAGNAELAAQLQALIDSYQAPPMGMQMPSDDVLWLVGGIAGVLALGGIGWALLGRKR